MGLNPDDPRPHGITIQKAYAAIRRCSYKRALPLTPDEEGRIALPAGWWGLGEPESHVLSDDYERWRKAALALPTPSRLSEAEMILVLKSVMCAGLEFSFWMSDGQYRMGAYAEAALNAQGLDHVPTQTERLAMRSNALWPGLFPGL